MRNAVHLAESLPGSDRLIAADQEEEGYSGALVAEGNFYDPSEGYG